MDSIRVYKCDFCGSVFGERICYFCDKICCTSGMTDDKKDAKNAMSKRDDLDGKKS